MKSSYTHLAGHACSAAGPHENRDLDIRAVDCPVCLDSWANSILSEWKKDYPGVVRLSASGQPLAPQEQAYEEQADLVFNGRIDASRYAPTDGKGRIAPARWHATAQPAAPLADASDHLGLLKRVHAWLTSTRLSTLTIKSQREAVEIEHEIVKVLRPVTEADTRRGQAVTSAVAGYEDPE